MQCQPRLTICVLTVGRHDQLADQLSLLAYPRSSLQRHSLSWPGYSSHCRLGFVVVCCASQAQAAAVWVCGLAVPLMQAVLDSGSFAPQRLSQLVKI